jgi:hypothetical protein
MATTEPTDLEQATCPCCEDYSGEPSSVEAHISRLTDDCHKGEVGSAYRQELQERVVGTRGDDRDPESTDEGFPEDGDLPSVDPDTEVEADPETDDTDSPDVVEQSGLSIPIPVSTTVLFTGLLALLAVVVLWRLKTADTSDDEPDHKERTAPDVPDERDAFVGGGR